VLGGANTAAQNGLQGAMSGAGNHAGTAQNGGQAQAA
jgi:hypothetical protein